MNRNMERRQVLKAGAVVGGVAVGATVVAGCSAAEDIESGAEQAAATASVPVTEVPVGGGYIAQEPPVVITQPESGDIKAFTAICPHAGCLVSDVVANEIICPCHGSKFSAVDGSVISGPSPSGLNGVAYEVTGETVTFG